MQELKTILFAFWVLSFSFSNAQNTLEFDTKEVSTTTSFDFDISLTNSDAISAIQFDINYNAEAITLETGHVLGDRATGHTLAVSNPSAGVIRVVLYSASNSAITGNSGLLCTLKLKSKTLPGSFSMNSSNLVVSSPSQTTVETNVQNGSVTVLGPRLGLSTSSIQFGRVPIGSSPQRTLTVQNLGNQDLEITGFNTINPFAIQESFPITIPVSSSRNLTVTVDSSTKYNDTETLVFQNNDPDNLRRIQSVSLQAEVYAVNEIQVGSGNGEINTEIEIPVVIENMEPFNGFQFDIVLPNNFSFVQNSITTTNRLNGHSLSASAIGNNTIRFLAFSTNNSDFNGNDGEVFRFKVKPNVSSGTYTLRIQDAILSHTTLGNIVSDVYNGSVRIDAPNLYISPSNISYGNVPITETRETDLRLTNYGSAQLQIHEIIFDNAELSLDTTAPIVIEQGQSKTVKVTFDPDSSGSFSETISFRHNGASAQNIVTLTANKFSPNYLKLEDIQAKFGVTNNFQIGLYNNDPVKAIQFDITLPNGFTLDANSISTVGRAQNFSVAGSNTSGNTYRILAYNASNEILNQGGDVVLELPVALEDSVSEGVYSVSFSNVVLSGTDNSNIFSIAIDEGQITVTEVGSLQVNLSPEIITNLGGQWRLNGGDWQDSGTTLSDLPLGNYTVDFKEVANWNTPSSQQIVISKNELTTISGVYVDPTKPTVVITSDASNPTNNSFTATFTFSEAVTGFNENDINISNATLSNFVSTSSTIYSATILPTADGTVTINIPADVAQDNAGNTNNAADSYEIVYDGTKPSLAISSDASNPTNTSFEAIFIFSEPVSGFTIDDIVATNANVSNFTTTSSSVYAATITPVTDGTVTVDVAEGVAEDNAGNTNNAAEQYSIVYDGTRPEVVISSDVVSPTNDSFSVNMTFTEAVSGFTIDDLTVSNATVSNFTTISSSSYSATITPTSDGAVTIAISEGKASDAAGNTNTASSEFSLDYDATPPTVSISSDVSDPTNDLFEVTITFSEDVTGFTLGDISLGNATASNFDAISATVYKARITPISDGTVTVDVASAVAQDGAGNANTEAPEFSVVYDSTLSIENYELEKITLYPNPVQEILYLRSDVQFKSISIYNILGKKVLESRNNQLNVNELPNGVYLVKIQFDNQRIIRKIIKE